MCIHIAASTLKKVDRIENTKNVHIKEIRPEEFFCKEMKLYRYMSYYKLETLFQNGDLYMSNTKTITDNHEREIPESFFNGWPRDQAEHYKKLSEIINKNVFAYLSCWSTRKDDYALWKIYDSDKNGCMVETTLGRLMEQLKLNGLVFYKVEYVGKDGEKRKYNLPAIFTESSDGVPTLRGCEKFKRLPYEFENEVRAVLYSKSNAKGILVGVDVGKLIIGAMYNPLSTEEDQRKVERLIHSKMPELEIENSVVDETEK